MDYRIVQSCLLDQYDKMEWLERICFWHATVPKALGSSDCIHLIIGEKVYKDKFYPFHIVTLSCLIESFKMKGYLVMLEVKNAQLERFIHNDVSLILYWKGEKPAHIESPDPSRLNLWRVAKGKAEEYEASIHRYFSGKFPGVDFFMLKSCLSELYFNIFDHADANGVDFSYIHYDNDAEIIHIAICDFGKGIARTIKEAYKDVENDNDALVMSLKKGVSARSNGHNAGFGLDNVLSSLSDFSTMRIVSNSALLLCMKKDGNVETKAYNIPFNMNGTLIYFDMPISSFELTEVEEEFTF